MRSSCPLLILLFSSITVLSQNPNYTALDGPYGGPINEIVSVGTRLVGSVFGQGIVISDDGGATWTTSNTGLTDFYIYDLEPDPISGKLYALAYYRLFSSSDNGDSWVVVATTGFSQAKLIKKSPNGYLFIANVVGTIYRSTDGGTNWPSSAASTLPGNPNLRDFEISPSGYLFVATDGAGVFRSNSPNSTVGFTQLGASQGLTSLQCYSLAFEGSDVYVTTYTDPFKSSDNGSTWASTKSNITDPYFYYPEAQLQEREGSLFLFNAARRAVYRSDDRGANWIALNYPMDNYGNENSTAISFYVQDVSTLYVSYEFGTFKSTDGGINWFDINDGITGFYIPGPDAMTIADNGRLFFVPSSNFGFYMSIDDGANWDFLYASPMDRRINGFKKIGSTIYAYGGGLIKTENNGDLWTEVVGESGSIVGCNPNFNYFANADATNFYSISTYDCSLNKSVYNLLKSSDAGATWNAIAIDGLPPVSDFYVAGDNGLLVGSTGYGYILINNTALSKYQIFSINLLTGEAIDISPAGYTISAAVEYYNGNLYTTAFDPSIRDVLLTSTDDGQNWGMRPMPYSYGRLQAIDDNTIYLLSSNAYISTDGGDSWVDTGTFGYNRRAGSVNVSPSNYSYITVQDGPIFKSTATVVPPTPPTSLSVFGYSDRTVGLKWDDNSTSEQYFILERSDGNNTSYDSVRMINSTSQNFVITTNNVPEGNTLYYFRVRAVSAAGKSAYSNEVSVTTAASCDASTVPINRSWTAITQNESSAGVFTNDAVFIQSNGLGGLFIHDLTAGATSGVFPPIQEPILTAAQENCGQVFMTMINPIYANGNGTWDESTNTLTIHWQTRPNYTPSRTETTVFTLNATDPAPAPPGNLGAYVKTENEIVFTWSTTIYAQQYQVQRSETSGSGFVDIGDPLTTPPFLYIDNYPFETGKTYYYRVVATALGGASTPSAEMAVTFETPKFTAISLPGFDDATQGVAWADLDNDDDEDLLVSPFNKPNGSIGVFENMGDGTFQNTTLAGVSDYSGFIGLSNLTLRNISAGDINNDGMVDFLTLGPVTGGDLWINKGNKEFERVGLTQGGNSPYSYYGQLVDLNDDGKLDAIFSSDQVETPPATTSMKIFTQNASGSFDPYELGEIAADMSLSFVGSWADFDQDGDEDFLRGRYEVAASDYDQLYQNNGDGTFTALPGTAFEADYQLRPRSISWGDFDNDIDLDVYVVNNTPARSNMLYQNNGDGTFTRLTSNLLSEVQPTASYGSAWGDVDNDGDLDMVLASTSQSQLYLNDGAGNFSKHTGAEYLVAFDVSRTNIAFAFGDYDKNGTLDIATGKNLAEFPTILLRNNLVPDAGTQWLEVKLKGTTSNASGLGARIFIQTPDGRQQLRHIAGNTGNGSASSLIAHFGLKDQSVLSVLSVYWPSGIIQTLTNVTANRIIEIIEDGAAPVVTSRLPARGATGVSAATTLELTFNEPTIAVAGKTIKLTLAGNPSAVVFTADVTSGTKTGETFTYAISPKLQPSTAYDVIIEEAAFEDVWENPTIPMSGEDWSFTTDSGPLVTLRTPAHNATDVSISTNIEITFDRPTTAVAGKQIRVRNNAGDAVFQADVTSGTFTGNKYVIDPPIDFAGEQLLEVLIDYGAFIDNAQNDFTGVNVGEWTFTTIDVEKPLLAADPAPLAILDKGFEPITFSVSASDNVGVDEVSFFHRTSATKDFTEATMTSSGTTDTWSVEIQNTFANDMGFEFYIVASDAAGNSTRSPAAETEYYISRVRFTDSNAPVISVPGEGTEESWRIIALPYDLSSANPQVGQVFEDMGSAGPKTWRLITYTNVPEEAWLEFPNGFTTLQQGKGYFINSKTAKDISLSNATSSNHSQQNLYELQLVAGWNQIGNPYTVPINWNDVIDFNNAADKVGILKLYINGSYVNANEMVKGQGGFVLAQEPITLLVSFPGQNPEGGRIKSDDKIDSDLAGNEWIVPLTLTQGSLVNRFGGIGMHGNASHTFDRFDDANAPRFQQYMEMNFDHPEHFLRSFARDVVPHQKQYTWRFSIDSNVEGQALLQWDNSHFGDNANDLFLLDERRQVMIDMRLQNEYVVTPSEHSAFKVYFGKDLEGKISPAGVFLGMPYPNPAANTVSIDYTISDEIPEAHVQLQIYDLLGRKIISLVNGNLRPGFYKAEWNVGESEVSNGVLICELVVAGRNRREVKTRKIIIHK